MESMERHPKLTDEGASGNKMNMTNLYIELNFTITEDIIGRVKKKVLGFKQPEKNRRKWIKPYTQMLNGKERKVKGHYKKVVTPYEK